MPKGVPNRKYSPEFKHLLAESMRQQKRKLQLFTIRTKDDLATDELLQ